MAYYNEDCLDYNVVFPEAPVAENIIQENLTQDEISTGTQNEPLPNKLNAVAALLCLCQLFISMGYAVIAVFFPQYAFHRGLNESDVGFIFASYFVATVVSSPIIGLTISHFGTRYVLIGSYCLSTLVLVFLSLCVYLPDGRWLFWSTIALRFLQGIGFVGASTSTFTLVSHEFPGHVGRMTGYLEAAQGSGLSLAAFLGGVIYKYGGFSMPFYVLAICYAVVTILCWCFIPASNSHLVARPTFRETFTLLTRPSMYAPFYICMMVFFQVSVYSTVISPTLQTLYHWDEIYIGLAFSLTCVFYALNAPIVGLLIDKLGLIQLPIILGITLRCVAYLLLGPTPIFGIKPTAGFAIASNILTSIGSALSYIPVFSLIRMHTKLANFPDTFHTSCLASSLLAFSGGIGAIIGPILIGQFVDRLGYQLSLNIVGYITFSAPVVCAIDWLWTWYVTRKTNTSSDHERTPLVINDGLAG
ncbi:Uncharacterised protein g10088 [Pycnogonum litorale]